MNQKQNQNTGLIGSSIKMRKTESTKFCFHFEFTSGSQEKYVPGLHSELHHFWQFQMNLLLILVVSPKWFKDILFVCFKVQS